MIVVSLVRILYVQKNSLDSYVIRVYTVVWFITQLNGVLTNVFIVRSAFVPNTSTYQIYIYAAKIEP